MLRYLKEGGTSTEVGFPGGGGWQGGELAGVGYEEEWVSMGGRGRAGGCSLRYTTQWMHLIIFCAICFPFIGHYVVACRGLRLFYGVVVVRLSGSGVVGGGRGDR